jgi:Ca2+-binding EF-hand superfamily protein
MTARMLAASAVTLILVGASADTRAQVRDRGNTRFAGMDRNGDGVITREEWRGSDQSFRVHDWNNDGVLSGDEVRQAARSARENNEDFDSPDRE